MDAVAIIGFSAKLPGGVEDASSFWDILQAGRNVMTDWPKSRINIGAFHEADSSKKNMIHPIGAHFLQDDPGLFDAPFFSITAREAAAMDPQQRLLLETSYRALENAGISMAEVNHSQTAVYEASMVDDYNKFMSKDPDTMPQTAATGTAHAIMANRISWFFNFLGPSLHVDTACSSGMVALDLACQSLRSRDSTMALVAGSNLILGPEGSIMLSRMNFLSPDSLCYSFDHRANGYARGEGTIVMVLKRLSDAIDHADTIRAIIRGSGTNQDGHTPAIVQPSSDAQEQLIRSVYRKAGLDFGSTRYVEAHGTGTPVGDPIEMGAIGRVFRTSRSPVEPLYVGSVKTNIGHLEGASGLAGVLKAVLILEKGIIPPNANFEKVNPYLDTDFYNTMIPDRCVAWPGKGLRRISVNSFGFGGSNGHVILDDAFHFLEEHDIRANHFTLPQPQDHGVMTNGLTRNTGQVNGNVTPGHTALSNGSHEASSGSNIPRLLVWSAADELTLGRLIQEYKSYYENKVTKDHLDLDQLASTLSTRRSHLLWRSFALLHPHVSIQEQSIVASKSQRSSTQTGIAFVFTGQGAQYADMGLELMHFPVFRETLHRVNTVFASFGCPWDLFTEIESSDNIDRPEYSQPLCTALQIALIELLRSTKILPSAVVGHSSGEIAAAYTIGALTLESACRVAYYRGFVAGRLVATATSRGAMMSVNLPEDKVAEYVEKNFSNPDTRPLITVACVNSPLNVTVSADERAIDVLEIKLRHDEIFAQKLKTGIAYHSPVMEVLKTEYLELMGFLEQNEIKPSSARMVSSVTAKPIDHSTLSQAQYWVTNLVSPVQFSGALRSIISATSKVRVGSATSKTVFDLVEVGPHASLRRPCVEIIQNTLRKKDVRYNSVLLRTASPTKTLLELVGNLYSYGYPVSIPTVNEQVSSEIQKMRAFLLDTPPYPFNHSKRYWIEPRESLDYRMRAVVPRDVLGTRAQNWNPLQPKWRKIINVDELPWVADHVVNGDALYPATGMLVMAIEAAKQVAHKDRPITAYYIKEATFSSPIVLRPSVEGGIGVEVMLTLRPIWKAYEKESVWSEISICAHYDGTWTECFQATIQTQYKETRTQVDGGKEHNLMQEAALAAYEEASRACVSPIPFQKFYSYCNERGLLYGESFRILEDLRWDGQQRTVGYVDVSKPTAQYAGLVHPAVIDAAAQTFWTTPSHGLTKSMPTEVPHRMFDTYVAATGWKTPDTSLVRILTTSRYKDIGRGVVGSISCYADDGTLLCKVSKIEMDPIADDDLAKSTDKKLLYGIEWKPCLSSMNSTQLHLYCNANHFSSDEVSETEYLHQLDKALRHAISSTLVGLSASDRKSVQPHFQRYIHWMEGQANRISDIIDDIRDNDAFEDLLSKLESKKPAWRMLPVVARNLPSIIRGEINPLNLLFSTSLAETFYEDISAQLCDTSRFYSFLELAAHQNPELRILEVGAGTGGLTSHVLDALQKRELDTGGTCFIEYTYTDVSHGFFENAKAKFQHFSERMSFKAVDLERSVTEQGVEGHSYDIIIAGNVLHATKKLNTTLRNLHEALKPGGKLVFFELTKPDALAMNFGFGIFPGWWASTETWRSQTPAVDEERWHQALQDVGFSGNDLVLRDYKSDVCHNFSIIVSTAQKFPEHDASPTRVLIVHEGRSEASKQLVEAIEALLHQPSVYQLEIVHWDQLPNAHVSPDDLVIVIAEMTGTIFNNLSESTFQLLKTTIQQITQLLWVTATDMQNPLYPYSGVTTGFMRTMRSENISKHIVTLILDGIAHDANLCARHITTAFQEVFEQDSSEVEYAVQDGQLVAGRLVEESDINESMHATLQPRLKSEPWNQGPALMFTVRHPGTLDTLEFVEDATYDPESHLGEYELEVEAHAWGVNFRDIFMALGRLDENDYGFDCGGIVKRVGSKCTVSAGDRVIVAVIGCMRSFVRCQQLEVIKLPHSFKLEDAVAVAAPGITAYHSLVDTARLQKGERILIHSATGATGQVAVQIAQSIGAEIYATVGTNEKKQFLIDAYHIPEDYIFYSRNTSFAQGVMRMTHGKGVHVVLNSLSGDSMRASWECVAPYGRFIEIGKVDIKSNSGLPMSGFARNISFTAVDLHHVSSTRKDITQHLLSHTMRLLSSGVIKCPSPVHVFPVSQMEEAFRFFQTGKSTGRTVISISPSDIVPKSIVARPKWSFDEHATYIIVGGLGGIGRALCRWMMQKGAKHLILPSRDGVGSQAAMDLIKDLKDHGVNVVAPTCDASSIESLRKVINECAQTMPPVKGCINAAMVLQDAIFEAMTHAQWEATIRSKVETSWNLHTLLPHGMDFFILLSSLSGIYGSVSQANYAAGNTFKDALARYRTSHGEKAVAFNLGWMRTIGIIAESNEYRKLRELSADMAKIEAEELLSLFEIYCNPTQPVLHPDKSQLLVGVVTPGECIAMGMEPPFNMRHPLFSGFRKAAGAGRASGNKDEIDFSTLFQQAGSRETKAEVVVRALAVKLGRALSMAPDDIDTAKPLFEYGVDSLVAVELRNWIGKEFTTNVAVFDIIGGLSIEAISTFVAKKYASL